MVNLKGIGDVSRNIAISQQVEKISGQMGFLKTPIILQAVSGNRTDVTAFTMLKNQTGRLP